MSDGADIHTARFGNRGGTHDVIQDSGASRALLDGIKWFTDRPGTRWRTDSGWTQAGYSFKGHYVVQATRPDHQADRSGMVTTTALLIPVQFIPEIDLGLAFDTVDALAEQDRLRSVDPVSLRDPGPCRHAPGARALADTLASGGVTAWLGPGHRDALACLWRHLGSDDRLRIAFTATDHPDVAPLPRNGDSLRVLVAPAPPPAAFAGMPAVTAESDVADGPAAALFEPAGHPASLLADGLGVVKPTLRQWQYLMTAERELRGLDDGGMQNTLAVLALLGLLAPDPAAGADLKMRAINRLRDQVTGRPYEAVRGIRTVPWDTLPEPDARVTTVISWVRRAAAKPDAPSIAAALTELERRDDSWFPELGLELTRTLTNDARLGAAVAAELILQAGGRAVLRAVLSQSRLGTSSEFDRAVYASLAGRAAAAWVPDEARQRGWAMVHASVADISDPVKAWRTHLPVATDATVELLAGRVAPAGNVEAALTLRQPELIGLAGRLVAADPALLSPPRPDDPAYRQVWASAVRNGMPASACCSLADAAPALVDACLHGPDVDDVLLEAVLDDAGPVLARHPDRALLWRSPGSRVTAQLRTAVAAYVARDLGSGDPPPEEPLAGEILTERTLAALAREQPAQAVTVLEVLHGAARDRHGVLVAKNMTRTTPETAYRLGSLARGRRWRDTAWQLVTSGRSDLQPAAQQAGEILGFFDRIRLLGRTTGAAIPEPNDSELREAILDELSRIYWDGPSAELWERAGGHAADLPRARTARQTWREALTAIAAGRAGTPSLGRLLAAAHEDHPRNDRLPVLRRYAASRKTGR